MAVHLNRLHARQRQVLGPNAALAEFPSGCPDRLLYGVDPLIATIGAVSHKAWDPVFAGDHGEPCRQILRQLEARCRVYDAKDEDNQMPAALTARRLLKLAAAGIDPAASAEIGEVIAGGQHPRLPSFKTVSPTLEWQYVTEPHQRAFRRACQRFWRPAPWYAVDLESRPDENFDDYDRGEEQPRPQSGLYRLQATVCAEIGLTVRELPVAISAAHLARTIKPERQHLRVVASLALTCIAGLVGVPLSRLFNLGIDAAPANPPRAQGEHGYIDTQSGQLWLKVGDASPDIGSAIAGRVPRQWICHALPAWLLPWLRKLSSAGLKSVLQSFPATQILEDGRSIGHSPLQAIHDDLKGNLPIGSSVHDLTYVHRAGLYVAVIGAQLPVPYVSLIRNQPIGPSRAALHYACYTYLDHLRYQQQLQAAWGGYLKSPEPPITSVGWISDTATIGAQFRNGADVALEIQARCQSAYPDPELALGLSDLAIQLTGARPSRAQFHPPSRIAATGDLVTIADKPKRGRAPRHRLVPIADALQPLINATAGAGRGVAGNLHPQARLERPPAANAKRFFSPAASGAHNEIRKILYTEVTKRSDFLRTEIFDHGPYTFVGCGPLCPVAYDDVIEAGRKALDAALRSTGLDTAAHHAANAVRAAFPAGLTALPSDLEQEITVKIGSTVVPSRSEHNLMDCISEALMDEILLLRFSAAEARKALFLLLASEGRLPLRYLKTNRQYLRTSCFFEANGSLFLAAQVPQRDSGLGPAPLIISKPASKYVRLLVRRILESISTGDGSAQLFSATEVSSRAIFQFARQWIPAVRQHVVASNHRRFTKALTSASELAAVRSRSGFVVAGLMGRLIYPMDYVSLPALLGTTAITSIDGTGWTPPFLTGVRARARQMQADQILAACSGRDKPSKVGRPMTKLPSFIRRLPSGALQPVSDWSAETLGRFLLQYHADPSFEIVKDWFERRKIPIPDSKLRGALRVLRESGGGSLGHPIRLLKPENTVAFVRQFEDVLERLLRKAHLRKKPLGQATANEVLAAVLLSLLFGLRGSESARFRLSDLLIDGQPITDPASLLVSPQPPSKGASILLIVRGTKNERAFRTVEGSLFLGSNDSMWELFSKFHQLLMNIHLSRSDSDPDAPLIAEFTKSLRTTINNLLDAAAARVIPSFAGFPLLNGKLTHHGLRHACAFRAVSWIAERAFEGNFFPTLVSLGLQMGHTIACLLGTYIGSAAVVLPRPR